MNKKAISEVMEHRSVIVTEVYAKYKNEAFDNEVGKRDMYSTFDKLEEKKKES